MRFLLKPFIDCAARSRGPQKFGADIRAFPAAALGERNARGEHDQPRGPTMRCRDTRTPQGHGCPRGAVRTALGRACVDRSFRGVRPVHLMSSSQRSIADNSAYLIGIKDQTSGSSPLRTRMARSQAWIGDSSLEDRARARAH